MDIEKILKGIRVCECALVGHKLIARLDDSFLNFFGVSTLKEDKDVGRYSIYVCSKCLCKWRDEE
jgi:hypothetical protein